MNAWVDGAFVDEGRVPQATAAAPGPFETMGARRGEIVLWARHLERLVATACQLGLSFVPEPSLRAAATALLLQNGHGDDVLRLSLVPAGATLHTVMVTRARGPRVRCVRLLPTVVEPPRGHRGDLKLWPRPFYDAVRQQAQDGGADDGIVVAPDGAVRETAIANLWLRLDGVWVTPALDGQVLPGIARALLLQTASVRGREVRQRRCDLADLHRAEALACSNATSGPRPAALLSAEATVVAASERLVAGELLTLWRDTVAD